MGQSGKPSDDLLFEFAGLIEDIAGSGNAAQSAGAPSGQFRPYYA